jgi:hypothetical protein
VDDGVDRVWAQLQVQSLHLPGGKRRRVKTVDFIAVKFVVRFSLSFDEIL